MAVADAYFVEQLKSAAQGVWSVRWSFSADMNADGIVTISDAALWLKWVFFAPGDCALLLLMIHQTQIALFLEIDINSVYGFWSGVISVFAWLFAVGVIREI